MLRLTSALITTACIGWTFDVRAQAAPAPAPATIPAPAAKPIATTPALATAGRDRSGVVLVEQGGRVLGLGIILNDDGRVLTASSRLNPNASAAGPLFVRYPDGKLVQARIGQSDRERDLALLVPKTLAVRKGILASRSSVAALGTALGSFASGPNRNVVPLEYAVKSVAPIARQVVLELSPVPKAVDVGGPLLDARGRAVGMVVSGCVGPASAPAASTPSPPAATPKSDANPPSPGVAATSTVPRPGLAPAPCSKSPVGLPVAAIRAFLRTLSSDAAPQGPWLGIDGISADTGVVRGIRIGRVEPKSPAALLGLQISTESVAGDLLVAVGGKPVPTIPELEDALSRHAAGERVDLLVFGKDGYKTYPVRLAERPAATP